MVPALASIFGTDEFCHLFVGLNLLHIVQWQSQQMTLFCQEMNVRYLELLLREDVFEDFLLIVNYAPIMKEKVLDSTILCF